MEQAACRLGHAGERFALSFNTSAAIGGPMLKHSMASKRPHPCSGGRANKKFQKGNCARGTPRERKEISIKGKFLPLGTNRDRRALRDTEKTIPVEPAAQLVAFGLVVLHQLGHADEALDPDAHARLPIPPTLFGRFMAAGDGRGPESIHGRRGLRPLEPTGSAPPSRQMKGKYRDASS
jgi:hypothetical protein